MPPSYTRNTRSMFTQDGRPAESQAPAPMATNSAPPWCDFDVSWTASQLRPPFCRPPFGRPDSSTATTKTERSLPRPSRSSNGTQVHTISPGSGSPSVAGEYVIRTAPTCRGSTSTVAAGPERPGESSVMVAGGRPARDGAGVDGRFVAFGVPRSDRSSEPAEVVRRFSHDMRMTLGEQPFSTPLPAGAAKLRSQRGAPALSLIHISEPTRRTPISY